MHNNHCIDGVNKDINLQYPNRQSYLKLIKGFESKLDPIYVDHIEGIEVVREDLSLPGGTKTRAAEYYFSILKNDVVVYVTPRYGLAGAAIIELCKLYNKKAIFFMPACREISDHQAYLIDQKPLDIKFKRIAAMPNLNSAARDYAKHNGYEFLPFGLKHPLVTAGFVKICDDYIKERGEPDIVYTAVSTGVLTRGLQIGFPNAQFYGVCVARNMKQGELGRAKAISDPLAFHTKEKTSLPPFDTVENYDAKVWKYIPKNTNKRIMFWNVGKDIKLPKNFDKSKINSWREWNDTY